MFLNFDFKRSSKIICVRDLEKIKKHPGGCRIHVSDGCLSENTYG